jgi:hypothetical protein
MERKRQQDEKKITPEALAAFRKMRELERQCTCPKTDWEGEYWKRPPPCWACDAWWEQHWVLHQALRCEPWEWPCVEHPDTVAPHPAGSPAAKNWKPDLAAQARYRTLQTACGRKADARGKE